MINQSIVRMNNTIFLLMLGAAFASADCVAQPRRVQEYVVVVTSSSPHRDIQGLVSAVRANPGRLNCGAGHPGTTPGGKAACESFAKSIGAEVTTVPYKSFKAMVGDLNGRMVDFGVLAPDDAQTWMTSGKLRALAVSVDGSPSPLPGVPTMAEAGFR